MNYYVWEQGIAPDECDRIIEQWKSIEPQVSKINDSEVAEKHSRDAKHIWIDKTKIIHRVVASFIHEANRRHFKYKIVSVEDVQFTIYEKDGFYAWHTDSPLFNPADDLVRKLSCTVELSRPEEYKGGQLQLFNGEHEPVISSNKQGTVTVFNSSYFHRVTPVTEGKRYSMVMWASGPNFV